jgi:hypothetical protein
LVLDYPGGVLGDIALFLTWKQRESASRRAAGYALS